MDDIRYVEYTCQFCDRIFHAPEEKHGYQNRKYCSVNCRMMAQSKPPVLPLLPPYPPANDRLALAPAAELQALAAEIFDLRRMLPALVVEVARLTELVARPAAEAEGLKLRNYGPRPPIAGTLTLGLREIAFLINVSVDTVRNAAHRGVIPGQVPPDRLARRPRVLYVRATVEKWIDAGANGLFTRRRRHAA